MKRLNEQLKLLANLLDNLAVGTAVGAILVPSASERPVSSRILEIWIPVAVVLHPMAQATLGFFLGSEE